MRETYKSIVERHFPAFHWRGHTWAPWATIGPYRISVRSSKHETLDWISPRHRKTRQPIVMLEIGSRKSQYWACGNDPSLPHGVNEIVKDARMHTILVARQLGMDTSSLRVNPMPPCARGE